jgi:hypothetical protein
LHTTQGKASLRPGQDATCTFAPGHLRPGGVLDSTPNHPSWERARFGERRRKVGLWHRAVR